MFPFRVASIGLARTRPDDAVVAFRPATCWCGRWGRRRARAWPRRRVRRLRRHCPRRRPRPALFARRRLRDRSISRRRGRIARPASRRLLPSRGARRARLRSRVPGGLGSPRTAAVSPLRCGQTSASSRIPELIASRFRRVRSGADSGAKLDRFFRLDPPARMPNPRIPGSAGKPASRRPSPRMTAPTRAMPDRSGPCHSTTWSPP